MELGRESLIEIESELEIWKNLVKNIKTKIQLHYGDMIDSSNLCAIVGKVKPDEIYNLAAQFAFVKLLRS